MTVCVPFPPPKKPLKDESDMLRILKNEKDSLNRIENQWNSVRSMSKI
jgi:hypothetical protein